MFFLFPLQIFFSRETFAVNDGCDGCDGCQIQRKMNSTHKVAICSTFRFNWCVQFKHEILLFKRRNNSNSVVITIPNGPQKRREMGGRKTSKFNKPRIWFFDIYIRQIKCVCSCAVTWFIETMYVCDDRSSVCDGSCEKPIHSQMNDVFNLVEKKHSIPFLM